MDVGEVSRRLWAKLEKDLAASPFAASLKRLASAQTRFSDNRGRPPKARYSKVGPCPSSRSGTCSLWNVRPSLAPRVPMLSAKAGSSGSAS